MGEYINIDGKNYVTEKDYLDMVKFYENSLKKAYDEVKQLEKGIEELRDENRKLMEETIELMGERDGKQMKIDRLKKENERLKELEERLEGNRFFFRAQMELSKPKTFREAEDLQKAKKIYEELYMKELRCVEEENQKLKEDNGELIKRHKEETDLLCKEISNLQEQIRFNTGAI